MGLITDYTILQLGNEWANSHIPLILFNELAFL